MILKFRLLVGALSLLCLFIVSHTTFGFIERRYTLPEVIDSSTNVVFGTVESVDVQKLRAVVKVEEDVMGKSGLNKIRINLAVGQRRPGTSPEEMIKYFQKGKPVVLFYDKHSGQLNSLGHVGGKWFQCKTFIGEGKDWKDRWWTFTHIEIHMHRTFKGWTADLQKQVGEILQKTKPILANDPAPEIDKASENHIKVLIFSNRKYPAELRTLRKISKIGKYQFAYRATQDQNLPGLEKVNILWLGYRALGEGEYSLNGSSEKQIRKFVKNGGILIASGQDSDSKRGWFAGRLKGVESETQMGIHPSENAGDIFRKPNKVVTGNIYTEDSWNDWGKNFIVLATTNDRRNVAVGMLKYGKGMYLITSLHHETYFQASSNGRLMENLIHFAAKHLNAPTPKVQYASIEPNKSKSVARSVERAPIAEDKVEAILTHPSTPSKNNERSKEEDELGKRISNLQKKFSAIQTSFDQLEEESIRDEDKPDELDNKIGNLQNKFSAIRKDINQLEEESRRDFDKSQLIKPVLERSEGKEGVEEKELQPIPTELPPQQEIYKKIDEIFSKLQRKIDLFNQEITNEFSNSNSELEAIEKRLERFRKSVDDVRNSVTELDLAFEK